MEQMVGGSYQQLSQPELIERPVYSRFSNDQSAGQEIALEHVKLPTPYNHISEKIRLEPVYVVEETNELVYNSRMMENGKKYHVVWGDERFMLVKDDESVTIYRFEADAN